MAAGARRRGADLPDVAPVLSAEEVARRRQAPSEQVMLEEWYIRGKRAFVAKCAGCHPAGTNSTAISKSLFLDDLERNGYAEPERVRYIIRYGKGRMPGFAKDCTTQSDYTQCGVIVPLSEETLQDLQDFITNRANAGWKGRG